MSGLQLSSYDNCRLVLTVSVFCCLLYAACVASLSADGLALLEFKKAITDDPHGLFSDWNAEDALPCQWGGITCSGDEVTEINLYFGNFTGTLPESMGQIRSLANISLARNFLSGPIPSSIFNLTSLKYLDLYFNDFTGFPSIPSSFSSMSSLEYLDLSSNLLVGEVPASMSNLKKLRELYLRGNQLTNIPSSFGSLDSVEILDISSNLLSGSIPPELGDMKSIQVLRLFNNQLTGSIPKELAKAAATMINLDLGNNSLSGPIPAELGNLTRLLLLHLQTNMLNDSLPERLFSNMTVLEDVFLYENLFIGELPQDLGLVQRFLKFDCCYNTFSGPIPPHFCKGGNQLERLVLMNNNFSGPIPDTLGECPTLNRLRLSNNRLTGSIPKTLGKSQSLDYLDLMNNSLTGPIPAELGNCSKLQAVIVSGNQLNGSIPSELSNLRELDAGNNHLTGNFHPELCSKVMDTVDLSNNNLSGQLPLNLDICKNITLLLLAHNQFSGLIPPSVAFMDKLQFLDLSYNVLTGPVPVELSSSATLRLLDISYNNLEGPLSVTGFIATLNSTAVEGNPNLCGIGDETVVEALLRPCTSPTAAKKNDDKLIKGTALIVLIVMGVLTPFVCWLGICLCIRSKFHKKNRTRKAAEDWSMIMFQKVPYLSVEDVLNALDDENVVGRGGSGKVYRGEVRAGKSFRGKTSTEEQPFVVKKFRTPVERGSGVFDHGFRAEVETLGNIRHYNVVKLLACCSSSETKLLVYEYMQNGSLADLLHGSKGGMLEWETRYKIALGAAQGLTYLHHDCLPPILHRDVSSSNILLDIDFNARLADFGLAKLVEETQKPNTVSILMGSHGYIAPECAFAPKANEKTDVYSYGVVLLELVTGRRAVEGDAADGEHITMWTQWKIREKEGVIGALDPRLIGFSASAQEEMMMLLRLGLFCTSINPEKRPGMREVVRMLIDVRSSSEIPMQGLDDQTKKNFRIVVDERLPPIHLPQPQLPDTPKSPPPLITL